MTGTNIFKSGGSPRDTDPVMDRVLLTMIDQLIAQDSVCRYCESPVELEVSETDKPYQAWLRCTNSAASAARNWTEAPMNEVVLVPLTLLDPNPYQPREREDAEHVQKIALSIAQQGLLQTPVGRVVNPVTHEAADAAEALRGNTSEMLVKVGWRVQLAFGHTRLAAYRLLNTLAECLSGHSEAFSGLAATGRLAIFSQMSTELEARGIRAGNEALLLSLSEAMYNRLVNGDSVYHKLPVALRELSDEAMFQQGISENLARKDLTPLEEARAMARYREDFKKTSEEIGHLFGVSNFTVRGKMRLLQLPADLQQQLANVSELVLRELLYMLDLPEEYRNQTEQHYEQYIKPSTILKAAIDGEPHGRIAERVTRLVIYWSRELTGDWKHDRTDWPESSGVWGRIWPSAGPGCRRGGAGPGARNAAPRRLWRRRERDG